MTLIEPGPQRSGLRSQQRTELLQSCWEVTGEVVLDFSSDFSFRFSTKQSLNRSFRKSVFCTAKPRMNESTFDSSEEKSKDGIEDSRKHRSLFNSRHTNKPGSKLSLNQSVNENLPYTMKQSIKLSTIRRTTRYAIHARRITHNALRRRGVPGTHCLTPTHLASSVLPSDGSVRYASILPSDGSVRCAPIVFLVNLHGTAAGVTVAEVEEVVRHLASIGRG